MGNCLSKDQAKDVEEVLSTGTAMIAQHIDKPASKVTPAPQESKNLLSDRPNIAQLKDEQIDPEKAAAMLDMGIQVIDLFQKVAKATEKVLPSPLGDVLEKVTSVLGVLKKMAENRTAWRELLSTIDSHQKTFNDQLTRLKVENKVPDPESPLLGPVIQYSDSLEKLAAKIMTEGGLVAKDAPENPLWDKIKTFTIRAIHADDEKGSMDGYLKQLSTAMEQFKFTLEIFVGFTVDAIKGGVESLSTDVKVMGQDMKDMREAFVLSGEPKDNINARNVTPFGAQHKHCLEGTRVDVIEEIRVWAAAKESTKPVYCIGDVAGTGKSTLARTLFDQWGTAGPKPLAFFFSQEGASVQTATDFCFFIKEQIKAIGFGREELVAYWTKLEPNLVLLRSQGVQQQWEKLVYEPLCMLPKSEVHVLVVDALDECTSSTRGELLECLLRACASGALPHIRVFITTRNEADVLKLLRHDAYSRYIIHKALRNATNAKTDVEFYVNHRLDESGVFAASPEQRRLLIERCDGLFIFAFLACQLLEDSFGGDQSLEDVLHEFTSLDVLYHQTLSRADRNPKYTREILKNILSVIVVAREPLSIAAIAALLPTTVKTSDIEGVVGKLGSILGSGAVDEPVYILHATFTEFLLRQNWVMMTGMKAVNVYAISMAISNRIMARSCLSVLLKELKRGSVEKPTAALRYAALVWISHLLPELHIQDLRDSTRTFFKEKLLNWIELGTINNVLSKYMLAIGQLQSSIEKMQMLSLQSIRDEDVQWCRDILHFLQLNNTILQESSQSVYSSAIMFTPDNNLVHHHYESRLRDTIPAVILGRPTPNSGSAVLTGHDGGVFGIQRTSYSSAGELLVSTAGNTEGAEIMVWDVQTGARLMTHSREGVIAYCFGVAFLPGNKEIVSVWTGHGSRKEWQLWRLSYETNELAGPPISLKGEGDLKCIAWAVDWTYLLCGTTDGRIYRFSLETGMVIGECVAAHEEKINTLSFSPNGSLLVSTSADQTFKIWSATPDKLTGPTFVLEYRLQIYGAAFCPADPSLLAVAAGDALHIYNSATGALVTERPAVGAFCEIAYSPDGKYIATRGFGQQYIDLSTRGGKDGKGVLEGSRLETGHTLRITTLTFSPDMKHIASGAYDQTLRIANLADAGISTVAKGHKAEIRSIAFTPDNKRCVSWDHEGVLCIWNLETGELIDEPLETGQGPRLRNSIAYSSDGLDVVAGDKPEDIVFIRLETKKMAAFPIPLALSLASGWSLEIHALAVAPDDTSLALMGSGWFEGVGRQEVLCIRRMDAEPDAPAITVESNIQRGEAGFRMAYHPSGDYICCADSAWELVADPPARLSGDKLLEILEETFPVFIQCSYDASNQPIFTVGTPVLTTITFGSPIRHTFCLPPELLVSHFSVHDALLALGSQDGRVTILDFTCLLTPEEKALLCRICDMRKVSAQRITSS